MILDQTHKAFPPKEEEEGQYMMPGDAGAPTDPGAAPDGIDPMALFMDINPLEDPAYIKTTLKKLPGMSDKDLLSLSREVWGSGYRWPFNDLRYIKAELRGFLLDQLELISMEDQMFVGDEGMADPMPSYNNDDLEYTMREGNKFLYRDGVGNYIRRTNAPKGHPDYDEYLGEADTHYSEPLEMPQYFSQDGRKLHRAPIEGAEVLWNKNYHPQDAGNLWAARWVNPYSGQHEYAYMDSDLIDNSVYGRYREMTLVDGRLPFIRQFVNKLAQSGNVKDLIVAVSIALVDQGRMRVNEIASLRVGDIYVSRNLAKVGRRYVYLSDFTARSLKALVSNRPPQDALLVTAVLDDDGYNIDSRRVIGYHMINEVLEELGVSEKALHVYHANQVYSKAFENFVCDQYSAQGAHMKAMMSVAYELGHDLSHVPDYHAALQALENVFLCPCLKQALMRNVQYLAESGECEDEDYIFDSYVPYIDVLLAIKSEEENEFSTWLRRAPIHELQSPI